MRSVWMIEKDTQKDRVDCIPWICCQVVCSRSARDIYMSVCVRVRVCVLLVCHTSGQSDCFIVLRALCAICFGSFSSFFFGHFILSCLFTGQSGSGCSGGSLLGWAGPPKLAANCGRDWGWRSDTCTTHTHTQTLLNLDLIYCLLGAILYVWSVCLFCKFVFPF